MSTPRYAPSATLLQDGRVLATGGWCQGRDLTSAELYDPQTAGWRVTGAMTTARASHTALLMSDGTVLVAGGYRDGVGALATTEHYEPTTKRWVAEADMPSAHTSHATAALPDGRALAECGSVDGASPSGTPEGGRSYEVYGSGASTLCDSIGPHRSAGAASPPP
jgi:hypothetical protein